MTVFFFLSSLAAKRLADEQGATESSPKKPKVGGETEDKHQAHPSKASADLPVVQPPTVIPQVRTDLGPPKKTIEG